MTTSSYGHDLTLRLSKRLNEITPSILSSPPSPKTGSTVPLPNSGSDALDEEEDTHKSTQAFDDRIASLKNALNKINSSLKHPTVPERLLSLVENAFPPFQNRSLVPFKDQTEIVELLLLAQVTISTYGMVISKLLDEAARLGEEDEYWRSLETSAFGTGLYLVQSTPSRLLNIVSNTVQHLREITTSSLDNSTALSIDTLRKSLPPSLLLVSMFPHLAKSSLLTDREMDVKASVNSNSTPPDIHKRLSHRTKKMMLLSLSPLTLTRQEVAKQRSKIKTLREDLANQIGILTLQKEGEVSFSSLLLLPNDSITSSDHLKRCTWSTLQSLDSALNSSALNSSSLSSTTLGPKSSSPVPDDPADFALSLHTLLHDGFPTHLSEFRLTLSHLRRPGPLTRAWPYLLTIPLLGVFVGRQVYKSRDTLKRWAVTADETIRGFVVDWVMEPVSKILATIRHGDDRAMALMGKESLKSDLESLQRMVVDFGRDEYKLSGPELNELAEKVRVGDLTSVLRVWEKDIKSPIRSAVSGSLIRTLLIQVQKVKVDVALAMDGIEKMLQSQQLTFGFVGVAPSLIILVGLGRWLGSFTRRDGGKKYAKEVKRRNWATMRRLDTLLCDPLRSSSKTTQQATLTPEQTQGFLLLELQSLRLYAASKSFPSKDESIKSAFMEDIKSLESVGSDALGPSGPFLMGRLWRWGTALGWEAIV